MSARRLAAILATIALGGVSGCAPARLEGRAGIVRATLSIDDPRPVDAAVEELERRFGRVVTYEDPAYENASEIADVTSQVRRDGKNAPRVLVPRGGKIAISYEAGPGAPASPKAVIEQVLEANVQAGNAGVFRIEQAGDDFHVIPSKQRDRAGQLVDAAPPLDARIDMSGGERSAMEAVEEIARLVGRARGTPVSVGTVPVNLLMQHRTHLRAAGESARSVLRRLLGELGRKVSWAVLYDPGDHAYALNLHIVAPPGR